MPTFLSLKRHLGLETDGRAEPSGAAAQTAGWAQASASAAPAQWLARLCPSEGAPALLLPLAPTCATLRWLLEGRTTPAPLVKPLGDACRFLSAARRPEKQMELALAAHSGGAEAQPFQSFCAGARAVLVALCDGKGPRTAAANGAAPPVQAALAQLQQGIDDFAALSREVWELHAYFVFLDIKGDSALLETVATQLCKTLRCSAKSLIACTERTERWVEEALVMLAKQDGSEMLQKRHAAALKQWRLAWVELMRQAPELQRRLAFRDEEEEPGEWFWARYFQRVCSVTWADFISGFQDFYLRGHCPVDIADQLRAELDPSFSHIIRYSDWKSLAGGHPDVVGLIDSLLDKALAEVAERIYRRQPLDHGHLLGEAALQASPVAEAGPSLPQPDPERSSPWCPAGVGAVGPVEVDRAKGGALGDAEDVVELRQQSAITTPTDRRATGPEPQAESRHLAWDHYCAELCGERPCWWNPGRRPRGRQRELQAKALAAVSSGLSCTRRALVLRVVAGSLQNGGPILKMPGAPGADAAGAEAPEAEDASQLPAVVVTANGSKMRGVAQFGRDAAKTTSQSPDLLMSEPIASRSHFSVVYETANDRYCLMDAGSKWGTFVRVTEPHKLSCGDWFHIGKAEFVVRHCGGGCARHRRAGRCGRGPRAERQPQQARPHAPEVPCEEAAAWPLGAEAVAPRTRSDARSPGLSAPWPREVPRGPGGAAAKGARGGAGAACPAPATSLPVPSLEIDFVAGPRMGEKLVLTDRVSTVGRSDAATVQISDSSLASISRIHCVFEYHGSRWRLCDNGSTNGTWQRLSCVLQPSAPVPLRPGTSVLAGTHEFIVEEAELTHWWLPSAACGVLAGLR